jgi:hypothetical protein
VVAPPARRCRPFCGAVDVVVAFTLTAATHGLMGWRRLLLAGSGPT